MFFFNLYINIIFEERYLYVHPQNLFVWKFCKYLIYTLDAGFFYSVKLVYSQHLALILATNKKNKGN